MKLRVHNQSYEAFPLFNLIVAINKDENKF